MTKFEGSADHQAARDAAKDLLQADEMKEVAGCLLRGYMALLDRGHHQGTIAQAMLGATLNLYDALDLTEELPILLRAIADRVEHGQTLS